MGLVAAGVNYEIHYGDPVHHGGPSQERIRAIYQITRTDSEGKRYFLNHGSWWRLRGKDTFAMLNKLLEQWK